MGNVRKAAEKVGETTLDKVVEKIVDALIHWVIALPIVAAAIAALTVAGRWLVGASVTVPGWVVAALCAALLVSISTAVVLWIRVRSLSRPIESKEFKPIPVEDRLLPFSWSITKDPATWITDAAVGEQPESVLLSVLDGPFHAKKGCNERLGSYWKSGRQFLSEGCPGCKELLFEPAIDEQPPDLWTRERRQSRNYSACIGTA